VGSFVFCHACYGLVFCHQRGSAGRGAKGFFFTPLEASHDPLRASLCNVSLGNRYINSVWTPLTLGPCGPQVIDIYCAFVTGFYDDEHELIIDRKVIAHRYVHSWFGIDVISCLPFGYISYLIGEKLARAAPCLQPPHTAVCPRSPVPLARGD
jgi:hypothetical protein